MTRAELNTSIDTVFDDNRAVDSLTPSMEGTELKKVADYVDQQVGTSSSATKVQKTTITSVQILDWHNTPVKIINGESGKIKVLLSYIMAYNFGSVAYTLTGTGRLSILYGTYGEITYLNQPFTGLTYSQKNQYFNFNTMPAMNGYTGEEDVNVKLSTGNYNDGDGGLVIYATYIETTL
jgi:hypothetical protein